MTFKVIIMLAASIIFQIVGASQLPRSEGFTRAVPTIVCLACLGIGFWLLARIAHGGVGLSVLIPITAAAIPLASVAVGVALLGEPASPLKIAVLISACALVGVAARIG